MTDVSSNDAVTEDHPETVVAPDLDHAAFRAQQIADLEAERDRITIDINELRVQINDLDDRLDRVMGALDALRA